jgi:hypothetical protein
LDNASRWIQFRARTRNDRDDSKTGGSANPVTSIREIDYRQIEATTKVTVELRSGRSDGKPRDLMI